MSKRWLINLRRRDAGFEIAGSRARTQLFNKLGPSVGITS
jgi:hypothetical protein